MGPPVQNFPWLWGLYLDEISTIFNQKNKKVCFGFDQKSWLLSKEPDVWRIFSYIFQILHFLCQKVGNAFCSATQLDS